MYAGQEKTSFFHFPVPAPGFSTSFVYLLYGSVRRDVTGSMHLRTHPSIYAISGILCAQRRRQNDVSAHKISVIV